MKNTIITFFFILVLPQIIWCNDDYFSQNKIYLFADYLFENKDYYRAAAEYQRFIFLYHENSTPDSLFFKIGLCFQYENKLEQALNCYEDIIVKYPESDFFTKAIYQIADMHLQGGNYEESIEYIEKNIDKINDGEKKTKLNRLLGVNYLNQKKWQKAYQIFDKIDKRDSLALKLKKAAVKGKSLPKKNLLLAGLMSSIVPGSGKVYANRFMDGLYSFVTIGLTGWQSYDGFCKDGIKSTKGWIYGSLSGAFYLGNIYGSIVAAKIYNNKIVEDFLQKIKNYYENL